MLLGKGKLQKSTTEQRLDTTHPSFFPQTWASHTRPAHDQAVADRLDLGPGSKVLDVGCGRGRVAHHMATYSGAHVTGINIDHSQVKMAKESLGEVEDE